MKNHFLKLFQVVPVCISPQCTYLVNLLNFIDQPCLEGSRLWTLVRLAEKEKKKIEANADRKYE